MITIVVPTRNRAYTLRKVLPSYFSQEGVSEVLLVNDAGDDETVTLLQEIGAGFSGVMSRCLVNDRRRGASYSRQHGAAAATTPYVLFCDDDEYLEAGYAIGCLKILQEHGASAVSGRRVYMRDGETPVQALRRFGDGVRACRPFNYSLCIPINGAKYTGVVSVPITNAIILTPRDLVIRYGFDDHYAKGNGYREETDYQMKLFVNGLKIFTSNDIHSIHLPYSEVRTGGQRISRIKKLSWSIYYNNYFLDKYYIEYKKQVGLKNPRWMAKILGIFFLTWFVCIRPSLYGVATALLYRK